MTLSSFLINTPQGNIVINSDYEETLPLMKKAIESLGFKMEDTKILLASHAHPDHQTADAMFKEMTGAQTMFMEQDVPALKNMKPGGKEHPIDRVLHDGDTVELGGMTLTAHLNPGHTPGTTTWTFPVRDGGRTYNVVIIGGGLQDDARLGLQREQPGDREHLGGHDQEVAVVPVRRVPRRAQLVLQPDWQVQEAAGQPEGESVHRSRRLQEYAADVEALRAKLVAEQTAAGPPPPRGARNIF